MLPTNLGRCPIFFLLLFSVLFISRPAYALSNSISGDPVVMVTIELTNGEICNEDVQLSRIDYGNIHLLFGVDEMAVFECTYQFIGGECTVTASTCDAAQAGFVACACAAGHDHYCGPGGDPSSKLIFGSMP